MSTRVDGAQYFVEMLGTSSNEYGGNTKDYSKSLFDIIKSGSGEIETSNDSDSIWDIIWKALGEWANSSTNAKKDVSNSNNRIKAAETSVENKQQEATKSITKIMNDIKGNISSIDAALARIQELSGDSNGGFEELQKELECEKEIITENIMILQDKNASEEDKEKALTTIEGCSGRIAELLVKVEDVEKAIGDLNKDVESYTQNIETQQDAAANVIADTLGIIEGIRTQAQAEEGVNTAMTAQGGVEEAEGAAGVTAAAAAEVISEGTATAVVEEAETNSIDRISAGGERIAGSAKNFTQLGISLNDIQGNFSIIQDFTNSIGSLSNDAVDLIGSYNYFAEPTIEAVGSWKNTVQSANALLGVAISNYSNGKEEDLLNFEVEQFGTIED